MEPIVPFTENATGDEAAALYFMLFSEALYDGDVSFASIEKYNKVMESHMNMLQNLDGVDDIVELNVGEDGVTLSLSDEFHRVVSDYIDEHGYIELD